MRERQRIPDTELAYYENTIAAALAIVAQVKALAYLTDDPDALTAALEILRDAQTIRTTTIDRMNTRKAQAISSKG